MRTITLVLLAVLLTVVAPYATAQVTNLTINGSSSSFTFVSGGTISWAYDIPPGDTATCEIWLDLNLNGAIDPATDHHYETFLQADGVTDGLSGPPDFDGTANGHVVFSAGAGIAPGTFVMRFSHNGTGLSMPGTVTPLASPAYTISGKVTVPAGKPAQYILIEASVDGSADPGFWNALTDANGDYVIQMNSDTAGGPWHVQVTEHPFGGAVTTPDERWVYPGTNPSGINFTLELPVAKIAGVVMDETGRPLPDWMVFLWRNDHGVQRDQDTDINGSYEIGPLGIELNGETWTLQAGDGDPMSPTTLMAQRQLPVLHGGDSLYRTLVIYSVNSQIQGQVKINGSAPGFPVQLVAGNADTAQISTQSEAGTGNFSIGVSNKIYNYQLIPINLGPNYSSQSVLAHPGDTGIQVNLTVTSVDEPASGVPRHFALEQNYPNPFNPTTGIRFQVPGVSQVKLAVYNILGQEVATLVNEVKQPGTHSVQFDASHVPSGFYFYRMTAGNFTSTKSMVVLK